MTTATIRDLIETLERLGKEATGGEWVWEREGCNIRATDHLIGVRGVYKKIATMDVRRTVETELSANGSLVVAYRNNHAQILSALRVAEVVPEIEKALKYYAHDGDGQWVVRDGDGDFVSDWAGFTKRAKAALAALQSAKDPT